MNYGTDYYGKAEAEKQPDFNEMLKIMHEIFAPLTAIQRHRLHAAIGVNLQQEITKEIEHLKDEIKAKEERLSELFSLQPATVNTRCGEFKV